MRKFFRRPGEVKKESAPPEVEPLTQEEYEAKKRELMGQHPLLEWASPARPYHKRKKIFYINVALLVLVIGTIVFLFGEYLLLAVILSLGFVSYVLAAVPPQKVEHKIVKDGVVSAGHAYLWRDLKGFWFSKKDAEEVLFIDTRFFIPSRLALVVGDASIEQLKAKIGAYLKFRPEPITSKIERASEWLVRKVPLE